MGPISALVLLQANVHRTYVKRSLHIGQDDAISDLHSLPSMHYVLITYGQLNQVQYILQLHNLVHFNTCSIDQPHASSELLQKRRTYAPLQVRAILSAITSGSKKNQNKKHSAIDIREQIKCQHRCQCWHRTVARLA
jgi:hypothetical protein